MSMRKLLSLVSMVSFTTLAAACGSSFAMVPDSQVPFAKGEVDASFEDAGNGKMVVRVEHLGDPSKLNAKAKTYVVWVQPIAKDGENKRQNMGALQVDDSYSGKLEFTTTFRNFEIAISPEENAEVTAPTGRDVLKATISAD